MRKGHRGPDRLAALAVFATVLAASTHAFCQSAAAQTWTRAWQLAPERAVLQTAAAGSSVRVEGLRHPVDPGETLLPYQRTTLVLPPNTRISAVRAVAPEWVTLGRVGEWQRIASAPSSEGEALAAPEKTSPAPPLVQVESPQRLHGYSIGSYTLHPVQKQEDRAARLLTGATIEIQLEPWYGHEPAARSTDKPGRAETDRELVRALVDNPRELPRSPQQEHAGKIPSLPTGDVEYLIVTSSALAPAFEPLAESRRQRGLTASVVSLEWIESQNRHGADVAETLREFLKVAYAEWGLRYVLLGGDTEVVPTRLVRSVLHPPGGFTDIPCDLYFAALDGNWNADADGLYGEGAIVGGGIDDQIDGLPELMVGRAPVVSPEDVGVFIAKTLAYEDPASPVAATRTLFMSEVLFPDNWTPSSGLSIILDGASFSEQIVDDSYSHPHNDLQWTRLYQNSAGYPGSLPETKSDALARLSSGDHGVVVHEGHGFFYNMSVGNGIINVSDADRLTNDASQFVLYALNCSSAAFDVACLLERFVQNPTGGAAASIGASRTAFPLTSNEFQQDFFEAVYREGTRRLGDAITASRLRQIANFSTENIPRWTHLTYTLLGDPTLELWRRPAIEATIFHPPVVSQQWDRFETYVLDGGVPLEGVQVTIRQNGFFSTAQTDTTGKATLDLHGTDAGNVELWVNGGGIRSFETTIPVTSLEAAVAGTPSSVLDDTLLGREGNADGAADAGETIDWEFEFLNQGGLATPDVSASLRPVDAAGATLLASQIELGDVVPGSPVTGLSFRLLLDPSIPDATTLHFELELRSEDGIWVQPAELRVRAPQLQVTRVSVDDTRLGDGDGVAEAGESVDLRVELENYGGGTSGAIAGFLSSASPNVVIEKPTSTWTSLSTKESTTNTVAFELSETIDAQENQLDLTIATELGVVRMHSIELRPPPSPSSPLVQTTLQPQVLAVTWETPDQGHVLGARVYRAQNAAGPFVEATQDVLVRTGYFADVGLTPLTQHYYYITAVDSSGIESAPSDTATVITGPSELAAFPQPLALEVAGESVVGDLTGNGTLFAVVGSDLVYAFDAAGNELVDGDDDPRTVGPISPLGVGFSPSGITLADLDGVPGEEIIGSSWNTGDIYVFAADGSVLPGWPRKMNSRSWGTPSVGDLDDDGDLEIVVHSVQAATYIWHHDGTDFFDGDSDPATIGLFHERPGEVFNRGTAALFDLDGDGKLEVIFGTVYVDGTPNAVHAFRNDRTDAPGWPQVLGTGRTFSSAAIGDLDADGTFEVVLAVDDNQLYVWNHDGSNFPGFPRSLVNNTGAQGSLTPSVALVDFDGDQDLEIVAVSAVSALQSFLYVFEHDGTVVPGWPVELPGLSEGSPVVGDLDGDSSLDILFGIGGGAETSPNLLYAFHSDARTMAGFPIPLGGGPRGTPTITDLDQDGDVDIVLAGLGRQLHVWDLPAAYDPQRIPWPTFHADSRRTGVAPSPAATVVPSAALLPQRPLIMANVPNPFNPRTLIEFAVPQTTPPAVARLAIFDVSGRRVRTLVHERLAPGLHQQIWNGRDFRGSNVASGIYFARLDIGTESATLKMTLVR